MYPIKYDLISRGPWWAIAVSGLELKKKWFKKESYWVHSPIKFVGPDRCVSRQPRWMSEEEAKQLLKYVEEKGL